MAQLLSSSYSANRCMNMTRRHQRLCKQAVNDETLSAQIEPAMDLCNSKLDLLAQKKEARENAYDDLILSDKNLDDEVRSNFEECKKYDRDNPAERVLVKIFPDEKFGEIIRLPFPVEVNEVDKMILRLESLGVEHHMNPFAVKLKTKMDVVKNALSGQSETIREEKMAEAEVEIAKEALVRQYELNYLDARRKYGRSTADKLFPKVQSRNTSIETDETSDSDE